MQTLDTNWLEETKILMLNRKNSIKLKTIADACKVSTPWLSRLQNGNLHDAPITKVQTVFNWLKDNANV